MATAVLPSAVGDFIASEADALDAGDAEARRHVEAVAAAGLSGLGAPSNHDGRLAEMAELVAEVAFASTSSAFSLWAHRMTIEYLTIAPNPWGEAALAELQRGTAVGATGMASAFKHAAGCGSLDVAATPVDGGFVLSGRLPWASNLHADTVLVTAAAVTDGREIVIGLRPGEDGVRFGDAPDLLALGSTASASVIIDDVFVPEARVLTDDLLGFLAVARPTFLVLQSAMCVGLARRCLAESADRLTGVNASVAEHAETLDARLASLAATIQATAGRIGGDSPVGKAALLTLRLAAAEIATDAAALELRVAGGRAYTRTSGTNRRFREAAFIPVQSPSETQLRWELRRIQHAA